MEYLETIVNTYFLIEIFQATSYGRAMFHPTLGTMSILYSFSLETTPEIGYVSIREELHKLTNNHKNT